jgi:hypothetical protein
MSPSLVGDEYQRIGNTSRLHDQCIKLHGTTILIFTAMGTSHLSKNTSFCSQTLLHKAKKRKQVNITIKQLNWLLGRKSNLAI